MRRLGTYLMRHDSTRLDDVVVHRSIAATTAGDIGYYESDLSDSASLRIVNIDAMKYRTLRLYSYLLPHWNTTL
jgi:hypothetical protein